MTLRPTLPLALVLAAACTGGAVSDEPLTASTAPTATVASDTTSVEDAVDTDEDGLSDADELALGTSPLLADTDGDGLSDGDEVIRLGYDPTVDATRFSPLVADQPQIDIRLASVPSVTVYGTSTTGESMAFGVASTSEYASSYTTSTSTSTANATETSTTWGTEAEVSASLTDFGASSSLSYEETETTSRETTVSYGNDYTSESRQAAEQSQELASYGELTLEGASLAVTVDVVNTGHLAYTIASLTMSARHRDLTDPTQEVAVGSLVAADLDGWAGLSQAPGDRFADVVFANDDLSWEQGLDLLEDPSGLVLTVSSYELLDGEGRSYALNGTDLEARTAEVVIDFGVEREPMRVRVATNARVDAQGRPTGVSVLEALSDTLHLDARFGTEGLDLEGLHTVVADREAWRLVSTSAEAADGLPADQWTLRSGDVLEVVWLDDSDGDGLFGREEAVLGTSNDEIDSDGDGLSDYDEVRSFGTNPAMADTDADGLDDDAELAAGTDPVHPDSDGDWLMDGADSAPLVADAMVERTGIWTFDATLYAEDADDQEAYVMEGELGFTADRMGRPDAALFVSDDAQAGLDHHCRAQDNSFEPLFTAGVSMWLRVDALPSTSDLLYNCNNVQIEVDATGKVTLLTEGIVVADLGQAVLGEWFHVTAVGQGTFGGTDFFAWRDGEKVDVGNAGWFMGLGDFDWVFFGAGDATFAVDHLSMLADLPTDDQAQQLMNEHGF